MYRDEPSMEGTMGVSRARREEKRESSSVLSQSCCSECQLRVGGGWSGRMETYRKAKTGTRTLESIKVLLRPEQSQIALLRLVTLISY